MPRKTKIYQKFHAFDRESRKQAEYRQNISGIGFGIGIGIAIIIGTGIGIGFGIGIKGRIPSKDVFHQGSSSIEGRLPSKVFNQSSVRYEVSIYFIFIPNYCP